MDKQQLKAVMKENPSSQKNRLRAKNNKPHAINLVAAAHTWCKNEDQ